MKKIAFLIILISSCILAQSTYFVSKDGSGNFSTIKEVNEAELNPGDIISFKSGQKFTDAILKCKEGIIYNTYGGIDKAIIGDSTAQNYGVTTKIDQEGVILNNLKIYGYKNASRIIEYSKGNLTISNCEIFGGENAHIVKTIGIYQTSTNSTPNINILFNEIAYMRVGISLRYPYNYNIGYNDAHDFYAREGRVNKGAGSFTRQQVKIDPTTGDIWDAKYTFKIYNNEIYRFEAMAFNDGCTNMIIEYNEIHSNLDERIYFGGCKHGNVGKIHDAATNSVTNKYGGVGLIFRYNYVHDLIRYGEAGYTYGPVNDEQFKSEIPNILDTDNGSDRAWYYGANAPDSDYGDYYGDNEAPDNVISGQGYGNIWIHNNIFYNCSNKLYSHVGSYINQNRDDLGSYFVNNTLLQVGWAYTADENIITHESDTKSPLTIINNIIDYTNSKARFAGYYKKAQYLCLDYNIYTLQSGIASSIPPEGAKVAAYYKGNRDCNLLDATNEQYLTNPNWVDKTSMIFAPNIGPKGIYIPDVRIIVGGNAHNKGMSYKLIGDTYTVLGKKHILGKDPTDRSFAYDIFGNLRTTNDIGAVGPTIAGEDINTPPANSSDNLKVFLEGPFIDGRMNSFSNLESFFPKSQPYKIEPWNLEQNIEINDIKSNYIDWLIIELRKEVNIVNHVKLGILTENGVIINSDGTNFSFNQIDPGEYYISIKQRNHLSILSSIKVEVDNNVPILYDFTYSQESAYGNNPMTELGDGVYGMYAGDADANSLINNLDFGKVANNIPSKGYNNYDLDMNGYVNVLDYNKINKNILKSSQIPK